MVRDEKQIQLSCNIFTLATQMVNPRAHVSSEIYLETWTVNGLLDKKLKASK